MISRQYTITFLAIIAASFTATAQNIYENVDHDGTVEFSDQSSPGAKKVNISPDNVIDVVPVKPIESSPPESTNKTPETNVQPEVIQEGGGTYYDNDKNRRQVRREHEEQTGRREKAPKAAKESGRVNVRRGAHRK